MRAIVRKILKSPERVFVLLALLFGSVFVFMVPPFQTPDEATHLLRAYEVASLKLPQRNSEGMSGSEQPASILRTQHMVNGTFRPGEIQAAGYHPRQVKHALAIPLNADDKIFYSTSGTPAYFPISYLPHAIVVWVLNLFNSPVILTLYSLRLMNLVAWAVLAYFSIKLFPVKKWAAAGVALLPMVVAQSASVGLDALYLGLFAVYFAIVLRAWIDPGYYIGRKQLGILLLAAIAMIMAKPVAAALTPVLFIVKSNKFKISYPVYAKVAIATVPVVLYILWGVLSQPMSQLSTIGAGVVSDPLSQINTLLVSPVDFVLDFIRTILVRSTEGFILITSVIGNFGMLDTPLSMASVVFGYMLLMFTFLYSYKEDLWNKAAQSRVDRVVLALCLIPYLVGVFLSMYIFYSLPEHSIIRGVNGRYLIPLLFILIPLVYTRTSIVAEKRYASVVIASVIMLFVASIVTLFYRYYVG